MRVAVISDVHGNLQALEAVLEHAGQEGIDELWCLGDIVGYGGKPSECLALVSERAAICLGGNHDLVVSGVLDIDAVHLGCRRGRALDAQRADARRARAARAASRPRASGQASRSSTARSATPIWEYVLTADVADASLRAQTTDLALVGHSHVQLALALGETRARGRQGRARPGGDARAASSCSTRAPSASRATATRAPPGCCSTREAGWARFMRSEYAIERAQADIRAAGLPNRLADRLSKGL